MTYVFMYFLFTLIICTLNNNLLSTPSLPHCFVEVVIDVVTLPSCLIKKKLNLKKKNSFLQAPQCATLNVIM